MQRDQRVATQLCLIAAAIDILINSACLDGNCAVAEDVGMFTVACTEQAAMDGSCPVNIVDRSANLGCYCADSVLHLNLGAAIGTAVLAATEHGADCTAVDGHIRGLGRSGRSRCESNIFWCCCIGNTIGQVSRADSTFFTAAIDVTANGDLGKELHWTKQQHSPQEGLYQKLIGLTKHIEHIMESLL